MNDREFTGFLGQSGSTIRFRLVGAEPLAGRLMKFSKKLPMGVTVDFLERAEAPAGITRKFLEAA